jgi:hypothetical protein
VGDSHNNIRLYTFENEEEIEVLTNRCRFTPAAPTIACRPKSPQFPSAATKRKYTQAATVA